MVKILLGLLFATCFLTLVCASTSDGMLGGGTASATGTNKAETVTFTSSKTNGNIMITYEFGGSADGFETTLPGATQFAVVGTLTSTCSASTPAYAQIYSSTDASVICMDTYGTVTNLAFSFACYSTSTTDQLFVLQIGTGSESCTVSVSSVIFAILVGTPPSLGGGLAIMGTVEKTFINNSGQTLISGYGSTTNSGIFEINSSPVSTITAEDAGISVISVTGSVGFHSCDSSHGFAILTVYVYTGSTVQSFELSSADGGHTSGTEGPLDFDFYEAYNIAASDTFYLKVSAEIPALSECAAHLTISAFTVTEIVTY